MAVGLVLIALGLVDLRGGPVLSLPTDSPWWHAVPLVLGGAVMVGKRRMPVVAFALGSTLLAADIAIGGSLAVLVVWWDLLYTVGLYARPRTRRVVSSLVVGAALIVAGATGWQAWDLEVLLLMAIQMGGVVVVPLWWAAGVRQGHELAAAADARARSETERREAVARAAALDRAEAVREERAAMARELHDVISSHLSAVAIHSGAALAAPPDIDRDRGALQQARAASITALEEMRTMIDLLRSEDGADGLPTRGGLGSLPALVGWAEDAGLDVDVHTSGALESAVSIAVDQAAARILQEALTNALKHGTGRADVAVEADEQTLEIVVRNPVPDGPTDAPARAGGTGLISMTERARSLGGTLLAAAEDGTFVVRASLPTSRAARP